jgi:hypothetical protein
MKLIFVIITFLTLLLALTSAVPIKLGERDNPDVKPIKCDGHDCNSPKTEMITEIGFPALNT